MNLLLLALVDFHRMLDICHMIPFGPSVAVEFANNAFTGAGMGHSEALRRLIDPAEEKAAL